MNTIRGRRSCTVLIAMVVAAATLACSDDPGLTDPKPVPQETIAPPTFSFNPQLMGVEGELLANVYESGQRTNRTGLRFHLNPVDAETEARIKPPFYSTLWIIPRDTLPTVANVNWQIEYTYPGAGGKCGEAADYVAGDSLKRGGETHPSAPGQGVPGGAEGHCIVPGRYEVVIDEDIDHEHTRYDFEYLVLAKSGGATVGVTNESADDALESVEAATQTVQSGGYRDVYPHLVLEENIFADSPDLMIENSHSNPASRTFHDQPTPSGSTSDWFRFSVAEATSTFRYNDNGEMLTRLWWDYPRDPDKKSGFFDAHSTAQNFSTFIKLHRFNDEVASGTQTVNVGVEIMRPDERPASSPDFTRPIQITAGPASPEACFTAEDFQTWRSTDQVLDASCSATGSNIRYSWQFTENGQFTAPSADPKYEFSGHSTSDTHTVTLQVEDIGTQGVGTEMHNFDVGDGSVGMTGPTWVTDKTLKTYSSNQKGNWFERFNPDTNDDWTGPTLTSSFTYNRIWAAGDYTVRLRNERTVSGELRRGRLNVTVCNSPGCMIEQRVAPSMQSFQSGNETGWGLFGLGPWISTAPGELVRFYDLTGLHDPGSAFATLDWLEAGTGRATDESGLWTVDWSVDETLEDALLVEFVVRPASTAAYLFGMGVDPDLGQTPVDDKSGYDNRRRTIVVEDGSMALGFSLLQAGNTALRAVSEYGARNQAPRQLEAAWSAHRDSGLQLRTGQDDVQLILSGPEDRGTSAWTLVIVRGASGADVAARMDEVYKRLGIQVVN